MRAPIRPANITPSDGETDVSLAPTDVYIPQLEARGVEVDY